METETEKMENIYGLQMLILAHKSNINQAEKHYSTPLHVLFLFFCNKKWLQHHIVSAYDTGESQNGFWVLQL